MFLPIRTDSPLRHTPYMNWALIIGTFIAFVLQNYYYRGVSPPYMLNPRDLHLWHFITYQFLHADGFHIIGNMLFLFIFGNNVNDKMGNAGYLAFYLGGGVVAGIAHVLISSSPVLGASGSVAAVTGAYLVLLPRSHITVVYFFIIIIGVTEIQSLWFVLIFFAKDVFYQMAGERFGTGTAHMAHIGGTMFGFGICIALLAVRLLPRDLFDVLALIERWNRRRQHRDAVSRGYDPFGYAPRETEKRQSDPHMEQIQDLRAEISELIAHHKLEHAAQLYLKLQHLDPRQVLARQAQLDVANQLFVQKQYKAAADAYEQFLRYYSKYDQVEQIQLILGILYARYLQDGPKAREHLEAAMRRLHNPKEIELARSALASVGGSPGEIESPPPPG